MISVIVSNFNGARFLPRLLDSLAAQEGVETEVLVVDRGSTDGSAGLLAARPWVRVLQLPAELGLVAGYHLGATTARSDLLFFCNEDMWFAPDCLASLAARIDLPARVGAVDGFHWSYEGDEFRHGGTRFQRVRWAINSPHPRYAADFEVPLKGGETVPFGCAGAILVHRSLYEEVGGWDRGFFLDVEDIDFFLRAWQRGWRCVVEPAARIHNAVNAANAHFLTALELPVSTRRYVSQRASLLVVAWKYFSPGWLLLNHLQWLVGVANNVRHGRWRQVFWDFAVLRELAVRWPAARVFRAANRAYNRHFPGERFFDGRSGQPWNLEPDRKL